jgi:cell division protein FtsQ
VPALSRMKKLKKLWPIRRRLGQRQRRRLWIGAALLTVSGAIGYGTHWLIESGLAARALPDSRAALISASSSLGFRVTEVFVIGRKETRHEDLSNAISLHRDEPMFGFSIAEIQSRLEMLPWVKSAQVERRLPDMVWVRIVERRPIAVWQLRDRSVLIDREGVALSAQVTSRFNALPMVVGEDAPQHAASLLDLLASEPELFQKIYAAVRVGGRRWNLRFSNGVDVQMPESGIDKAWARLAKLEQEHRLLDRATLRIDMREPDRLRLLPAGDIPPPPPRRIPDGKPISKFPEPRGGTQPEAVPLRPERKA